MLWQDRSVREELGKLQEMARQMTEERNLMNDNEQLTRATLKMFLDEQEEVPWESLVYVTGQVCFPINHARKGSRQIVGQSQSCMVVAAAAAAVGRSTTVGA